MVFGKPKQPKTFLALDVGTEVVKALVCTLQEGDVIVLGSAKIKQGFAAMKGGVIANLRSVTDVCNKAYEKAVEGLRRPKHVVLGIAGELVKGVMVEAAYAREDPSVPVSRDEIVSVIEKAKENALQESREIYAPYFESDQDSSEIVEVGAVVADVILDNFRVEDPVGLEGKSMTVKSFYTFAPRVHVGYLKSLAEALRLEAAAILPEPFTIVRAMKSSASEDFQGIVVDVGGGTTDVAIVKKGVFVGTEMVAIGGRVFTKRIAQDLMINHEEAEKIKIRYSARELSQAKVPEVRAAIMKDIPLWLDSLELALNEYESEVKVFPDRIFLCGGGSLLPEIKSSLVEFPWTKRLSFNRVPSIKFLTPEDLSGISDNTLTMTRTEDVTPMALASFGREVDEIEEALE